jgi:predicted dehydrogenase
MRKVALLGLGYWGSKLMRNLVKQLERRQLVVVDTIDRMAEAYDEYPGIQLAVSLEEALADDDVEAVLVATPATTHAELARQALEAGRHVLVEKPLASTTSEAVELAQLADRRGLTLCVGHTFLFSPRVQRIAAHLATGDAGRIHYVTSSRLNLGQHRSDVNVIWDLAPHDFSILFHLLGEAPVSAQTLAKSVVQPGSPDVAFISLTFPSGTIASVMVSWLAPRKVRSTVLVAENQMIVYDDTFAEEPIKIYDKGVVRAEAASFAANQLTYRYGDTVAPYVPVEEPLAREIARFLESARTGRRLGLSDGWFGVQVVMALDAADQSWKQGGLPVMVDTAASLAIR